MSLSLSDIRNNKTWAHVLPLGTFVLLNFLFGVICDAGLEYQHEYAPWWRHWPEQWMYPLQTVICGAMLVFFWKHYEFTWHKGLLTGALMGVVGIGFWLLPTHLYTAMGYTEESVGWLKHFGFAQRVKGFNPADLGDGTAMWVSCVLRFLRAAVVVAFVEEVFWRGFLMRFVLDPDHNYWKVPFGKFSWLSLSVVTVGFVIAHAPVDYAGAVIYGLLTYWVAVRTKSLGACVVMHAVANLLMGMYALHFGKYGLW